MGFDARVLVVDDDRAIRALVAKIVERAGFEVDTAADGAEALQLLEERDYGVLVVDLMMPKVDGFEVVARIGRRSGRRPAVIVVTAAAESVALRKLDGSVVHSVIRKPFDINVLGDLITAAASAAEPPADNVLRFPKAE
jgi:DNA-binding response OmpR family regulator